MQQELVLNEHAFALSDCGNGDSLSQLDVLQRLWFSLGVGTTGFLTVAELSVVCAHIGLHMNEQVRCVSLVFFFFVCLCKYS